ncbi:MAG: PD40 domain-containing protein, partial [Bacteroidia bacterium]|nr:PD40 domain-containing protein [Bacteroidia bacterium]
AVFGQSKLAYKFYKDFAYIKASELYEEAYERGEMNDSLLTQLGDCYYNNSNASKAAIWFGKAMEEYQDDIEAEYVYKYIQSLRSLKQYRKADSLIPTFKVLREKEISDARRKSDSVYFASDLNIYKELSSVENKYIKTTNLDLNTEFSDFGSFINGNTFYFASARDTSGKIYKWNEQPYLDIYTAVKSGSGEDMSFDNINLIGSEDDNRPINTPYHEASVAITKDSSTMYFTRDNIKRRKKLDFNRAGTSHLKIYKASLIDGKWGDIIDLPINDKEFSTGHPALSPDEKRLYFVSDRPGGYGQTDIYYVDLIDGEVAKKPEIHNLSNINTDGREMFPYISPDGTLYFSSDGSKYINLGLLDIYKTKADDATSDVNVEVTNMGAPFNSNLDDFAFYAPTDEKSGYFSSNREGEDAKGNDDIYSFAEFICEQTVVGVITDSLTKKPLAGAAVLKIDINGKILEEALTGADGAYAFKLECDQTYTILARRKCYKDKFMELITTEENGVVNRVDLELTPLIIDTEIVLNPITFRFDKWDITTEGKRELENIIDVMRDDPIMVIKIEAHTDCRGSDRYNQKLSERRAASTKNYLLGRGIAQDRIESAIGYGERQLKNPDCGDCRRIKDTQCHKENRRSVFKIVKSSDNKCE